MPFAVWWVLFGLPMAGSVFACIGLYVNWGTEQHRFTKISTILLALAAASLACGALAYVQFVRPIPQRDYRVESRGVLVSLSGTIVGLVTLRFRRWFCSLALGVSAWMLVLFFLAALTY
jgi:hypothetical protein